MRSLFAAALVVSLAAGHSSAQDKRKPAAAAANPDVCAEAHASARYVGYGYTHVVTLKNGCPKPVECALWTDVDPEPVTKVQVAPGERVEIVTRRGSPAHAVSAHKSCRFR